MSQIALFSVCLILVVGFVAAKVTPAQQCQGQNIKDLTERIVVDPCGKTRCKLRKGTNTTVHFRFNPKQEVKRLVNDVQGIIGGIPLPFIGVDGTNACNEITVADTGERTTCPLAPNQEYVYSNTFPVEQLYPSVPLTVHWGLIDGKHNVICFEMSAIIQ